MAWLPWALSLVLGLLAARAWLGWAAALRGWRESERAYDELLDELYPMKGGQTRFDARL